MKYIGLFSLFLLVVGCGNEDSSGEVGRYTIITPPQEEYAGGMSFDEKQMSYRTMILDTKTGRVY